MIRLTLPVPPSANRWWRMVNGRMIKSKAARQYLDTVRVPIKGYYAEGDVMVKIAWYRAAKRGDLDKRLGVVLDLLQGMAYENDRQVSTLIATRHEDPKDPRMEIMVCQEGEFADLPERG